MNRRVFLGSTLAASTALWAKGNKIDMSRVSVLTDEVGKSPADAIAFAKQYGLKWVELRGVPGGKLGSYAFLEPDQLKAAQQEFRDAGLRVSFLNTGMLKFDLPGTEPARNRPNDTPELKAKREANAKMRFESRIEDLHKAIRAAHAFDVNLVRIFTFSRVAEPETLFPRIADIIGEMALIAEKEGVKLLIENEGSCNVCLSSELRDLCKMIPSRAVGINWDPVNELGKPVPPFPNGYALLPKERVLNVQMKARALVIGPDFVDWKGIFAALEKDGYQGKVGLETHVFDGTLIEKAHLCMEKIKAIVA